MAELGLIAAVVQVADVGIRLSGKLYTLGQTVASADDSILFISRDISHTCNILKILGHTLKVDREARFYPHNAIDTADTIVKECLEIFHEMDGALLKKINRIGLDGGSSRLAVVALERLKWPFLRPKIMLLWSNLDKLKSSLDLVLNVFIYARLQVERTKDPSVVNDQRSMIEHLLRTTHEQSRKYEALKATMDRNENLEMVGNSTNGYTPVTPGVNAAMMRSEVPNKSKTEKLLEAPEADPATTTLDHYCTLIQQLMTEVEAKEYNIGRDMRCRIRDDVINTHKREMRLLRAVHGHEELGERMREKYWPLVEMAEERAEERQQSQEGRRLESSSGATFAPTEDSGPQELDLDPKLWSQAGATQSRVRGYEGPLAKVPKAAMDPNPQIELFLRLNKREDPWNHFHLLSEAPMVESPRAPEENGWLPYWISGVSKLAFHRILPLNSLKPHIRDDHTSTMPFFRSGTSMLVTDKSHIQETIASSQDLAALTDSTDTDTFVSARSEIGELALDTTHDPCFVEGEEDGPLVVLGDQGNHDTIGKDRGELGVANATPSLNEMLAAWVDVV